MVLTCVVLAAYLYHINTLTWNLDNDTFKSVTLINTFIDQPIDESDAPLLPRPNGQKSLMTEKKNVFYLNDMNLMPFWEIRFVNKFGPEDFDIFADSSNINEQLETVSRLDLLLELDYEKLRKYIQF